MKNLTLLILFLSFAINIFSQTTYTPKDIAGRYVYSSGYVGASFSLKDDGSYEYSTFTDCIPCSGNSYETGTYEIKETKVYFKIIKKEEIKGEKIKTEDEMQIIKWGERFYLIKSYDLYKFAAAINLGIEPRSEIINEDLLTSYFYLRKEDENETVSGKPNLPTVSGKPNLPKEWLSLILDSPIKVKLTKVEGDERKKTYTVNKGSADGLKVGMCFIGKNKEINYRNLLWVDSVKKHSAKLKNYMVIYPPYKIGDILTTKSYKN